MHNLQLNYSKILVFYKTVSRALARFSTWNRCCTTSTGHFFFCTSIYYLSSWHHYRTLTLTQGSKENEKKIAQRDCTKSWDLPSAFSKNRTLMLCLAGERSYRYTTEATHLIHRSAIFLFNLNQWEKSNMVADAAAILYQKPDRCSSNFVSETGQVQ